LNGETGPYHDTVVLNAAAALVVAGKAANLLEGAHDAALALSNGAALHKLRALQDAHFAAAS
jgi:anthranilate phosphoribosyltransferase